MKTRNIIAAVLFAAGVPAALAGTPDPVEVHHRVFNAVKGVRDVLIPRPVVQFVETFPPIAIPRRAVLQLAQLEPPSAPPPPPPGSAAADMNDFVENVAVNTAHGAFAGVFGDKAKRPVIVGGDAKSMATLEEDLNVMLRILEKAGGTREDNKATAMGIDVFSLGGPGSPRTFYLDGYGAMFLLKVRYPLLAPPKAEDDSRTNETTSSEWERARQEVYGTRARGDTRFFWRETGGEQFDDERVEKLKTELIEDLANATHIRNLKPDDFVTVVVIGGGSGGGGGGGNLMVRRESRSSSGTRGGSGGGGGGYASAGIVRSPGDGANGQTTMTLRAKKSDVDAFAKGKTKIEEFRKKVSVQVY